MPSRIRLAVVAIAWLALTAVAAAAESPQDSLPPKSAWRASGSAADVPALLPAFAIDGDPATKWGGPFGAGHWLQLDLGRDTNLGGVVLHWDLAFAVQYTIDVSADGKSWKTVYETHDSAGTIDYVYFAPVVARYLRVAAVPNSTDWGVNIYELEPVAAKDAPRLTGLDAQGDVAKVWQGGPPRTLAASGKGARELHVVFPQPQEIAGLEITWAGARGGATLEGRDRNGAWTLVADDPPGAGSTSFLAAREPRRVIELRLTGSGATCSAEPAISRLRLLGPPRVLTAMKRYEIAASRENAELFPDSLHHRQVYWTAVGVPAGLQKSIFDEYGHIEAFKGGPLVQALWRDASGRAVASASTERRYSLRSGWMPMPRMEWMPQPGLEISSEAFTAEVGGQPVSFVRHRVRNTGGARVSGQVIVLVRPMQLNPPWQNGGMSPIGQIALEGDDAATRVRVNGRTLLYSLTPVDARGAAPFGAHGETEITRNAAAGQAPSTPVASDPDGLAAAMLAFDVALAPGASRDVVVALPLGNARADKTSKALPEPPPLDAATLARDAGDRDGGAVFERLAAQAASQWQARFGSLRISLPDESLVNMLRSQGAYMLINQTGPAMQPGPRNYNRSFIRDGAATAAVLVRMGQPKIARDYLQWYAQHAVRANGLVSPILNDDGSNYTGFGSDIEYDSQGEFIYLVAEIARLDGGAATVRDYAPQVKLAMKFMQELRERTLAPGYMADRPPADRFRGILAPSISHEGYGTPTHSYWDDFWALKGWHDGAWLAERWGDAATAKWAREQYAALRDSLANSIRVTAAWRKADYVPTDADSGNPDPTSVSIGLDPTGQQDLLPRAALERTFAGYLADVRKRDEPGAVWGYTPYELRNTLSFVHLDQPRHADELLRGFLQHRRPLEWNVFAEVVQSDLRFAIYLGDMPHTWIGSEYARAVFGMLMREDDDRLVLLPGTPPTWVEGPGLRLDALPTAYGALTMSARRDGARLRVTLGDGLAKGTKLRVMWPGREKPTRVRIDGKPANGFTADAVEVDRLFRELVAEW